MSLGVIEPHNHSLLVILAVAALAPLMGDIVLEAFAAVMIVGLAARGDDAQIFRHKLDAIGFGFLIPVFFQMGPYRRAGAESQGGTNGGMIAREV